MSFFALAGEMVSALISGMKPLGSALLAEFRAGRLVFVFSEVYCSYRSSLAAPRRGSKLNILLVQSILRCCRRRRRMEPALVLQHSIGLSWAGSWAQGIFPLKAGL